jgi:hypothetical protein
VTFLNRFVLVNGDQDLLFRAKARSIFETALSRFTFARKSCSQILTTLMSPCARARFTSPPRAMFRAILASQYARFCLGIRRQFSQPCQKQPSTKIATAFAANQKSGTPKTSRGWSSQPLMRPLTNAIRSRTSVERFPRERTLLICRLRSDFDSESMRFRLSVCGAASQ